MNSLHISARLLLAFGMLILFLIGISAYSILQVDSLYESAESNAARLQALSEIEHLATKGFLYWEESLEGRANRSSAEATEQWTLARSTCDILIHGGKSMGVVFLITKDSALRKEIQQLSNALEDLLIKSKDISGDSPEIPIAYEAILKIAEHTKKGISAKSNVNSTRNIYDDVQTNLIAAGIVIILIGIFLSAIVSRSIAVPIKNAVALITRDGINTQLNIRRGDEIGKFTEAVDTFLISFRELVREVVDASSAVSTSSQNINISAEEMAQGAQDQLGQTSSVTVSLEEMSKTNYEIAHHIGNAKEMAIHAQSRADEGSDIMDQTVDSLNKMANMVQQSSDVINSLITASEKISKVVNIIEDITKQVNLIALNASIEASRAGEKGKGFAVVASEIKKLAERTVHSTTEISDAIGQIQNNVANAATVMEKSRDETQVTIRFALQTKSALNEISDAFKNVTMMVTQVAVSAEEQSSAGDQITHNVREINNATEQIALGTTKIAKSSEYLNQLTANLHKMMRRFKVNV